MLWGWVLCSMSPCGSSPGPVDVMSHDATDMEQEAVPDNGSVRSGAAMGLPHPQHPQSRNPPPPPPQDSPQKPPLDSGDVHSMQSMSVLLDRLAK